MHLLLLLLLLLLPLVFVSLKSNAQVIFNKLICLYSYLHLVFHHIIIHVCNVQNMKEKGPPACLGTD